MSIQEIVNNLFEQLIAAALYQRRINFGGAVAGKNVRVYS